MHDAPSSDSTPLPAAAAQSPPQGRPFLDTRPPSDFLAAHDAAAVNIPLEELAARVHELPPPYEPLAIFDAEPDRAEAAASMLRERDRPVTILQPGDVQRAGAQLADAPAMTGAATLRLWRPHALLVEAVGYLRGAWGHLAGRAAMDVASGAGRNAVYLAEQGLQVSAWDILPDAVARCADLARRCGVGVEAAVQDVTRADMATALPPASFDLVACFNFLHRPLMPLLAAAVRPGGFIVYETFVDPQRERFGKPSRPERVLRPGELRNYFQDGSTIPDWSVLVSREGLVSPRRIAASLIARRR